MMTTPLSNSNDVAVLLDVKEVAALLGISDRTIWRMADAGQMPRPLSISRLRRWRRSDLMEWIDNGCKSCRERRTPR